ncbi:MAG: hypothetical protein H0X37_15080 [Herpetosiphonaceae bacterium]|nr:hypothetical protein [Herpetosiphonaceae bacterium]
MCLTRGDCEDLFSNHGDPRNITMTMLQAASHAAGITVSEALANMQRSVTKALTGMTDWTGDQQGGESGVMETAAATQRSSAAPPPPAHEQSPYS